jgi:predicted Zn-dependent peptidase
MQKIDTYVDNYYGATSNIYELENGLTLVETIKEDNRLCNVDFLTRGGAYFEDKLGFPQGTAHFLEHILACEPNRQLKTLEEIDTYCSGNFKRPLIKTNGATSFGNFYLMAGAHYKGLDRALKYVRYMLDYPDENYEKYLERQRRIILSEMATQKEKKNKKIENRKFFIGEFYPEVSRRAAGTRKKIRSITAKNLKDYKNAIFCPTQSYITVQSNSALTRKQKELIKGISKHVEGTTKELGFDEVQVFNKFDFSHFQDTVYHDDVFVRIGKIYKGPKEIDYQEDVLVYLARDLLHKLLNKYLRQEKGYIYWSNYFSSYILNGYSIRGIKYSVRLDKLNKSLDELYLILTKKLSQFLESDEGEQWFVSALSRYIFPPNVDYRYQYALDIGFKMLYGVDYRYKMEEKVEVAKQIDIEEVEKYIQSQLLDKPSKIWCESPYEGDEIKDIIMNTDLAKYYQGMDKSLVEVGYNP